MSYEKAKELLNKYKDGTCTDEEKALVERLLFSYNEDPLELSEERYDEITNEIWQKLPQPSVTPIRRLPSWTKVAVAASVVMALSAGLYLIRSKKPAAQQQPQVANDIAPGGNKLILTLGNGKKIDLTDAKNGQVALQGQTAITKVSNGQIVYAGSSIENSVIQYNTVSAPRGGQGMISLPDGTKVWLNSSSSVTFPTVFKGSKRIVSFTGNVIFKPVHNEKMPFYASVRGQLTKDIGTEFDINAYDDEPVIKTTLLEGYVQVAAKGRSVNLKPGQQSTLKGNSLKVEDGDIKEAFAWRDGMLRCDNEDIQTVMRKISRWYDVEVVYQGKPTDERYLIIISRYKNITQALHMLEYSNTVHFKIEGRRITVIQ